MKLLKKMLKKILILLGFRKIFFVTKCYSQEGEDVILQRFYDSKMGGGGIMVFILTSALIIQCGFPIPIYSMRRAGEA